jgi:hypothetical protein
MIATGKHALKPGHVAVLDYTTLKVWVLPFSGTTEEIENRLINFGFDLSNIAYMAS